MKKASFLFLAAFAHRVSSQGAGIISCDESVIDFRQAFEAAEPVERSSVEVVDGEVLFDGVTKFVGCNHTHFGVTINGTMEVYETSIFRFNDPDPAPETCGDGNCYYSFCRALVLDSPDEGGNHSHTGGHGQRLLFDDSVRMLQHGEGHESDSNSTGHHGGHGGNSTDHDGEGHGGHGDNNFIPGYVIIVGHTAKCCAELDLETDFAHHTCSLETVFTAQCNEVIDTVDDIVRATEFSDVIHPPEHVNGFPEGHQHGSNTQHASAETIYFLGCNETYVDLFADRHIYTFALADLYLASESCGEHQHESGNHHPEGQHPARFLQHSHTHDSNETVGECLIAQCVPEVNHGGHGSHGGEHGSFRLLQHEHDGGHSPDEGSGTDLDLSGIDLDANADWYLDGYVLSTSIVEMCCSSYFAGGHVHGATALFTSVCGTGELFAQISAADGTNNPDAEADDEELYLFIFGGALFAAIALVIAVAYFAGKSEKKEREVVSTIDEIKKNEI